MFSDFWQFWEPPGLPKIELKSQKFNKKHLKIAVGKNRCFTHAFLLILMALASQKTSKIKPFFKYILHISNLWKLAKTIEKPMVFIDFSKFDPPKYD